MEDRLLSVIIPVYNCEKYIEECLDSIISQKYTNLEIVVVNDGSTDNSLKICERYRLKDPRIKIINQKNKGSVAARKAGLKNSSGKYITFVDGDDYVESDLYSLIMENIDDADVFAFGFTSFFPDGAKIKNTNGIKSGVYEGVDLREIKESQVFSIENKIFNVFPSVWSKVFRKEIIDSNMSRINECIRLGDDAALTFPAIFESNEIIINNEIFGYMYRQNVGGSITSNYRYSDFVGIENLYNLLYNSIIENMGHLGNQLEEYFIFLFRTEMVKEMSNPSISTLKEKLIHLIEIKKLKWVQYAISCINEVKIDKETEILLSNIDHPILLMFNWYIKRHLI